MAVSKRPMRVPSSRVSKAEFMRLQAIYDEKLRASGFRDIEDGSDLNLIDGSTFRRPSTGGHGAEVKIGVDVGHGQTAYSQRKGLAAADGAFNHTSVFDSPRARAWMRFSQAAHELPTDAQMRAILIDVADTGSLIVAATRNGVSRFTVYDRANRLCEAIGIDRRLMFDAVTDAVEAPPEPVATPARRLTKREVRGLRLEPPRAQKAS